ncbi:hypothetical protein [Piscibacillus halophilus]|uniref:Uncharacterized protein n=1 Tax=Piscibacillus halophilus TaxID=571933 RepID=A0A1H9LF68_9BACI|nr:hypothetical protein [Piscibacillus halophilus]SER10034.1 hypothetical protein SAMN05216362_1479 [Piscibacillus halophilus]
MSNPHIYDMCCRYHGRVVRIRERNGRVHVGRINRVTPSRVWIDPIGAPGGFGYGYGRFGGFRRGFGFGVPIALSFIAGVALASAFIW